MNRSGRLLMKMICRRHDGKMIHTAVPFSQSAVRMRRHRQRRRDGMRCLIVELRETEIKVLVRRGYLNKETRNDERAIIEALYAHLENTLV
jgi:hypothetical protein